MWLIDTETKQLKYVNAPDLHPYAILSHTWTDGEEVSFQEIANLHTAKWKPGFAKIEQTCRLAQEQGIRYAWIDTCCIDKTNSSELSEAINSMFQWYAQARVCFAYLEDMDTTEDTALGRCRWFTRGWTLQELIAPRRLEFYNKSWLLCGTKSTLLSSLCFITRIDAPVLLDYTVLSRVAVARRMSWASERNTTRTEDLAYCLFGIFDIHLPLIYGEGSKAFLRLQEAIAQESDDISLFAWSSPDIRQDYRGILARSPREFMHCSSLTMRRSLLDPSPTFSFTNKGLQIDADLFEGTSENGEANYLLLLPGCSPITGTDGMAIGLVKRPHSYLRRNFHHGAKYFHSWRVAWRPDSDSGMVHIPKHIDAAESYSLSRALSASFQVNLQNNTLYTAEIFGAEPGHLWEPRKPSFITERDPAFFATFSIQIGAQGDREALQWPTISVQIAFERRDLLRFGHLHPIADLFIDNNEIESESDRPASAILIPKAPSPKSSVPVGRELASSPPATQPMAGVLADAIRISCSTKTIPDQRHESEPMDSFEVLVDISKA